MFLEIKFKNWLGIILQTSIFISILLVLAGGIGFLWEHGNESFTNNPFLSENYNINILTFWHTESLLSPIGLIELGLLVLVGAQVLRVAMLCCYYTIIRDKWFMLFSFFILSVILFSLIWQ
jgi:uncharacterized membrane protein